MAVLQTFFQRQAGPATSKARFVELHSVNGQHLAGLRLARWTNGNLGQGSACFQQLGITCRSQHQHPHHGVSGFRVSAGPPPGFEYVHVTNHLKSRKA